MVWSKSKGLHVDIHAYNLNRLVPVGKEGSRFLWREAPEGLCV